MESKPRNRVQCKLCWICPREGAIRIFKRSVEKHGMQCVKYYGDGDSKSFEKVEHIYPGEVVK